MGRRSRSSGSMITGQEELETRADVRDAGLGGIDVKALRAEARRRNGGPMGEILDSITPEALKRATAEDTKTAKEMLSRARSLDAAGMAAVSENNFGLANERFKASAQAIGRPTWKNAMTEWTRNGRRPRGSPVVCAIENPTPQLRIGE